MKTFLLTLLIVALISETECGSKDKLSHSKKTTMNRLVNCLTPVDTVLAAKTADCTDSVCVSSAKKFAKSRYPQQYESTVVPCLASTTPIPHQPKASA